MRYGPAIAGRPASGGLGRAVILMYDETARGQSLVRLVLVVFGEGLIEVRYPRMELLFTGEQYIPASKRDRPSEKGLYHFDCVVAADDQFEGGVYRGIIGVFVVGALDIDNDPDLFRYLLPSSDAGFARFGTGFSGIVFPVSGLQPAAIRAANCSPVNSVGGP